MKFSKLGINHTKNCEDKSAGASILASYVQVWSTPAQVRNACSAQLVATFETLSGYFRDTFRTLSGHFQDNFRTLSEHFWDTFGTLLGHFLDTLETFSGLFWDIL